MTDDKNRGELAYETYRAQPQFTFLDPWDEVSGSVQRTWDEVADAVRAPLLERIADLEDDARKLRALEAAGVDNWGGYGDAMAALHDGAED